MIDRIILGRYTRAFVEIAVERNLLDSIENQLAEVDGVLRENPLLLRVLQNPLIARDKKKAILSKVFGKLDVPAPKPEGKSSFLGFFGLCKEKEPLSKVSGKSVDSVLRDFFFLLVDKRREEILPFLYEEFSLMADAEREIVKAEVESAYSLSSRQIESLTEKLSSISGKKVTIKQTVSPDIIGGVVITLGTKIIDASVVGRLKKLKECMNEVG